MLLLGGGGEVGGGTGFCGLGEEPGWGWGGGNVGFLGPKMTLADSL